LRDVCEASREVEVEIDFNPCPSFKVWLLR
jgi:hypothetical protein